MYSKVLYYINQYLLYSLTYLTLKEESTMFINVETDKRANIYALWEGKQIILCKKQQKRTLISSEDWVGLWPTQSGEIQMLRHETPYKSVDFALSNKGLDYLKEIYNTHCENKYIAKVEYIPIDGKQIELWEDLYNTGEFVLWDLELGPYKYFENSKQDYLAIYRVYNIDYEIKEADVREKDGRLSSYHKKLNEDASRIVVKNLADARPVLSDADFESRRSKILETVNKYPPKRREYKPSYRYISERNMSSGRVFDEVMPKTTSLEHKYCIYCGTKLHPDANFCHSCGKKQPTVQ